MFRLVGMLMYALFFASAVGYAFQPHHRQQLLSYRTGNILDHRLFLRLSSQGGRPPTDPSIIEHNRQYLSNTLEFSKEKLDKLEDPTSACHILTLDMGILDERVSWLKNRLSLNDNEINKITQSQPTILSLTISDNIEPKLNWLQEHLALRSKELGKDDAMVPSISYLRY